MDSGIEMMISWFSEQVGLDVIFCQFECVIEVIFDHESSTYLFTDT